jgi:hypothetical protein
MLAVITAKHENSSVNGLLQILFYLFNTPEILVKGPKLLKTKLGIGLALIEAI